MWGIELFGHTCSTYLFIYWVMKAVMKDIPLMKVYYYT